MVLRCKLELKLPTETVNYCYQFNSLNCSINQRLKLLSFAHFIGNRREPPKSGTSTAFVYQFYSLGISIGNRKSLFYYLKNKQLMVIEHLFSALIIVDQYDLSELKIKST